MDRGKVLAFCAFLSLGTFTCANLDNFIVSQTAQSVVPKATFLDQLLGNVAFGGFDNIDIAESMDFENQGYTRDQIDSVRIARLEMTIDAPEDGSFDFLNEIAFFAEADGLPRVRIAFLDEVPTGQTTVVLDLEDQELVDYATAPSISVTTEANGSAPDDETTITGTIDFNVDVNVEGLLGC